MSLQAQSLSVRLGGKTILEEITLGLERGRFVGLVGPNGAGKTTLMRTLAGLIAPVSGKVLLEGVPLSTIGRETRAKRIAAFFPGEGIGWAMRVREVVALGRLPHRRAFSGETGADAQAVERAMAATEVTEFAERSAPTLSAGERMRVLLARALAVEAEWLLADEPITALDPAHQLDAMTLLRRTAREGAGVVAVLHDLTLAARFCDRLVVMAQGRIAADDVPAAALDADRLATIFGITAQRGTHADGGPYILPWDRVGARGGDSP